jgi:hypothetical protein
VIGVYGRLRLLTDALKLLAAEPDSQLDHLRRLGRRLERKENIDELALEFDDIAPAVDLMLTNGEINKAQRDCVAELDRYLKQVSGQENAHLWTVEALPSAQEWKEVRRLARNCLQLF